LAEHLETGDDAGGSELMFDFVDFNWKLPDTLALLTCRSVNEV